MSRMLMPTLKEVPSDAEITSHQLMLRAGMIRKMASGIYNQLPMGIRVFRKVEDIIREEMNAKGSTRNIMCTISSCWIMARIRKMGCYGSWNVQTKR